MSKTTTKRKADESVEVKSTSASRRANRLASRTKEIEEREQREQRMKQETERAKREAKLRKREEEEKWMRDNMSQADKDDETVRDMKLTEECPKVIWECLVEALKTRTPEERRVAVAWMYTAIESHIGCCCNHKHWDYAIEDPVVHAEAISAVVAGDMKALSRMRTLCHESNLTTE